jgi:transposase
MKKEHEAHDWKEGRRLRAWERWPQGGKQKDSASALGLSKGAVSHWLRRAKAQGKEALYRHPAPGAPPKLSPEPLGQWPSLLKRGAQAFGFGGQVWTGQRGAEVIKRQEGGSYQPGPWSRLLERLKYRVQKPLPRASQRDEAARQRWKDERWPALKKKLTRSNERSCS